MKIKIKCPGNLAGSEGYIGRIWFDADGVSEPIEPEEAKQFVACFGGEYIELPQGASDINEAIVMARDARVEAVAVEHFERLQLNGKVEGVTEQKSESTGVEMKYSREGLERLADIGGIKAMREAANELGVKGATIASLIEGILKAQEKGGVANEVVEEKPAQE